GARLPADGGTGHLRADDAPGAPPGDTPRGPARPGRVRVRRARVLRDSSGYVRGYLPYLSFDVPAALRLLTVRRPDVVVVEPPPTTGVVVRLVCALRRVPYVYYRSEEHTSELQSRENLVCRLLLEKKKRKAST